MTCRLGTSISSCLGALKSFLATKTPSAEYRKRVCRFEGKEGLFGRIESRWKVVVVYVHGLLSNRFHRSELVEGELGVVKKEIQNLLEKRWFSKKTWDQRFPMRPVSQSSVSFDYRHPVIACAPLKRAS